MQAVTDPNESKMTSSRRIALVTGVLFITATVADLLGAALRPDLTGTDYLTRVSAAPDQVAASALLLLIAAFACAGIAVAMYPVLKVTNSGLALGAVVFRTLEAAVYIIGAVGLLSLLTLGQQLSAAGADRASLAAVGSLVLSLREHSALAGVFAFCLGASLYYVVLFQARLIPRWLSGWGIVAIILMATACTLALFNDRPVTGYALLALPIFLQEMVLAAWLIVKGFSPSPSTTGTVPTVALGAAGAHA